MRRRSGASRLLIVVDIPSHYLRHGGVGVMVWWTGSGRERVGAVVAAVVPLRWRRGSLVSLALTVLETAKGYFG